MKFLRMRTAFVLSNILCIYNSFAKNFYTNSIKNFFLLSLINTLFQMAQNNILANLYGYAKKALSAYYKNIYKNFKHNKSIVAEKYKIFYRASI